MRDETKIWIVGNAGVGKTSSLYRVFFNILNSDNTYPVPLLLQPRLFGEDSIKRLDSIEDDDEFLKELTTIWMENRDIKFPELSLKDFLADLIAGLKAGEIVIFLDSYDELSRFNFQTKVFNNLLQRSLISVCASRPETYDHKKGNVYLKIDDVWRLSVIKSFLERRLPRSKNFIQSLIGYISRNPSVEWLRNPRYLNLFVETVNDNEYDKNESQESDFSLINLLKDGEYALLEKIHSKAINRLYNNLPLNSPLKKDDFTSFYDKITRNMILIASTELQDGKMQIDMNEYENETNYWRITSKATEFISNPFFNVDRQTYDFKFLNYNFVDYFLTKDLAKQIYDQDKQIKLVHQWSNTLLGYLTTYFEKGINFNTETLLSSINNKLRDYSSDFSESDCNCYDHGNFKPNCCFMSINLMKLLFSLICLNDPNRFSPKLTNENFSGLYLDGVNFSNMEFENCNFSNSVLTDARFTEMIFVECDFSKTNLRNSHSYNSKFFECTFNLKNEASPFSPVDKMVLQNTEFHGCDVNMESFLELGAMTKESRYTGEFGKVFRTKMSNFLGLGVQKAEVLYLAEIEKTIDNLSQKSEVFLIDIMAGNMGKHFRERILSKFGEQNLLNLFAIDKDAKTIKQDIEFLEKYNVKYNIWEKEIDGRLELKSHLADRFGVDSVDLIIGKKAIHEISFKNQIELLKECNECLNQNGHLILYCDSPPSISNEGFERLNLYITEMRKNANLENLNRLLIDELTFQGSEDDCAIFLNLWIALKDLANDNINEFQNRYFSSSNQIIDQAKNVGLDVEILQRENCNLMAKMFNENAFSIIHSYLEKNELVPSDTNWITERLFGDESYQLLRNFTEKHLWKTHLQVSAKHLRQSDRQMPTKLGKKLQAVKVRVPFGKIHEKLKHFSFPKEEDNSDTSFTLPIHILAFVKN